MVGAGVADGSALSATTGGAGVVGESSQAITDSPTTIASTSTAATDTNLCMFSTPGAVGGLLSGASQVGRLWVKDAHARRFVPRLLMDATADSSIPSLYRVQRPIPRAHVHHLIRHNRRRADLTAGLELPSRFACQRVQRVKHSFDISNQDHVPNR